MKRKCIFLLVFLIIPNVFSNEAKQFQKLNESVNEEFIDSNFDFIWKPREYTINYIDHSSIEILSDADFSNYSFPGVGTKENPYIIENYNITTPESRAIKIKNTTSYFIIRGCLLYATGFGIYLENITSGTAIIENNIAAGNLIGIWVGYSDGLSILNNTSSYNSVNGILTKNSISLNVSGNICRYNSWGGIILEDGLNSVVKNNVVIENDYSSGISLHYANGTLVENNTCINNEVAGIRCYGSDSSIIRDNNIYSDNEKVGIDITDSIYVSVINNTVTSNRNSLSIHRSPYLVATSNKFYGTGLYIVENEDSSNYLLYTFEDNTVNDLILGYFKEPKSIKLSKPIYGQIFMVSGQDVTIKNQDSKLGFVGLTLKFCNSILIKNLIIKNTPIVTPAWGIRIEDSENIEINNVICMNRNGGMILHNTKNSIIKSNLCENGSFSGIWLISSNNNTLVNNTCKNNGISGIRLFISDFCIIMYNYFKNNGVPGQNNISLILDVGSVVLEAGSDFNIVHHNTFISDFTESTPQAFDDSQNNTWYEVETLQGNWWSDWISGTYLISGDSNSTDPYPLSKIPVYSDFNYKNFYYFFLVLVIIPAYGIFRAGKFLKEIRID